MPQPHLILVTGAPRSGTTAVGNLLAKARRTGELYEPMNATVGDPSITAQFVVPGCSSFSHEDARHFVSRVVSRQLRPRRASTSQRNPYFNRTSRTIIFNRLDPFRKTTVWKDPFAFFLVPQIIDRGGIPVVVTIRSPWSLAGSFKRMGWTAQVNDLAQRMREAGLPVSDAIFASAMHETGPARSGSILWMLYYQTLLRWLNDGVELLPVEAVDLIERPDSVAMHLASYTGLPIRARPTPSHNAEPTNPEQLPNRAHIKNRSAASITEYWRKVLDDDEVSFCQNLCEPVWRQLQDRVRI